LQTDLQLQVYFLYSIEKNNVANFFINAKLKLLGLDESLQKFELHFEMFCDVSRS
jgi:hypothetical protein